MSQAIQPDDIDAAFGTIPESPPSPPPESPEITRETPDDSGSLDRHVAACLITVDDTNVVEQMARKWLERFSPDHPPVTASLADGLRHYGGPGAKFEAWVIWRTLARQRAVWTGRLPGVLELALAVQPLPEPDEAPGIVPPPGTPDKQPRFVGIG